MKRFILQMFVFVGLLTILTTIPCLIFENKAKQCTSREPYSRVNLAINSANINADLIILGNSRAKDSYNDSILSELTRIKCLNLGLPGYPFDYQYHVMYENYIGQNAKPSFILIEIDPQCFFDYDLQNYIIDWLPYINRPEFKFYIELCPEISYADKFIFVRYFGKMSKILKELSEFSKTQNQPKKKQQWNKNLFDQQQDVEKNTIILSLFEGFIDECKDQNIELIMICSPMHTNDGAKYFDMDAFWNIISSIIKDKGIPVLNYQNLYGNDTTFFVDPVHLNKYGQECFTRKVAHDLDSLGLIPINQP